MKIVQVCTYYCYLTSILGSFSIYVEKQTIGEIQSVHKDFRRSSVFIVLSKFQIV